MTQIGFIGVGNMGRPMAANLVKAGHKVTAYDVVPELVAEAQKRGALAAKSVQEVVKEADFIISMLPASKHVESLYLGENGVLKLAAKNSFLIDCSTISPGIAASVALEAKNHGYEMIDAPVSGGTGGAEAGTLSFMVGGTAAQFEKARPILSAMGKNIFHAGQNGAGQVAKVCNNMLLAIHMIGTSEALALGSKLGMDPKVLSEIMSKSSGRNWSLEVYNPCPGTAENVPSSREYSGGFGTDLMLKDLSLAVEAAASSGATLELGKHSAQLYAEHSKNGFGKLDFSSIFKRFLK